MKKLWTILMICALALSACSVSNAEEISLSDYFSDRDLSGAWDAGETSAIDLNGQTAVSITEAGVYVLSGDMQGTVTVSADDNAKVQLVLNGVSITAENNAAIYVEKADKVFITLAEGTQNTLSSTSFDESTNIDGVIFSKEDLTLNGSGSLTVVSANHGIVGKDDLKVTGGTYAITAEGRGIDANDSVRIADGSFTVVSGRDAIRAKSEDEGKGYVLIAGGAFDLTVNGGAANGEAHTDDWRGFGRGGWNQYSSNTDAEDTSSSAKGIKAKQRLILLDGDIAVNSSDDAFHTDGDLTVYGGNITIQSGDDGMHADNALTINGGTIQITESYEGLEAAAITINDGDIRVRASDDGVNSSGGNDGSGFGRNDMFASDGSSITVNGGTLYVNADGDGIDANGDLTVNGGTVVVSGSTNSGNSALDYNGTGSVNGGTVVAAGAYGMAETFGSASTQVSFMANLTGGAGTITVTDANGKVLLTGDVEKNYQCVVISSPELQIGETYTVSNDTGSVQVTVSAVANGSSGNWGVGGGHGGWNRQQQAPDSMPQMPDGQQQMPGGQQQMPGGQMPGGNPGWGNPGGGRRK
ncbi:MAG: carbohydrate-binding domain-containing protein [Clostridia bacterium]|nr:carbohydrate-binding domain-containing protein [Clostridia bacterium]MBR1607974.1 carbohydrate-binding domain-containing protein [Clostridia bacterium]